MDEKMKEAFQKFCSKLTDEQKEKVKQCQTWDEVMDFAGKEGVELPDEFLDSVAGGFTPDWKPVELTYDSNPAPVKQPKPEKTPGVDIFWVC